MARDSMPTSPIDWTQIKTIDDVLHLDKHLLFDESETLAPINMLRLNPSLTEEETEDAFFWKDYTRGLMLVTGEPGSGKGIFGHMLAYKMKYYFNKLAVLDTRPREGFDTYGTHIPFSIQMVAEQVERMSMLESGQGEILPDGRWITPKGEIFLRNSVLFLDEFGSKYMPRLTPGLSISIVMLKLFDSWRHMQCLALGVGVSLRDFNTRSLDKANWQAICSRLNNNDCYYSENPEDIIVGVAIFPIKYNPLSDQIQTGVTTRLIINASEPKHCLKGKAWCEIFNTENAQGFELPSRMRRRQ